MAWKEGRQGHTVALLSAEGGLPTYDRDLSDVVGSCPPEATNSCPVALDVQIHSTFVPLIHQPVVSDLEMSVRLSQWPADPSQMFLTYTADPGALAIRPRVSWPDRPRPRTASSRPPRLIPRSGLNRSGGLTDTENN
jgi:hypothetical protein